MTGVLRSLGLACLCSVLLGCRGGDYTGAPRYPLSGKVTVDGQPLDLGSISFIPAGDSKQRVSGGHIADGVYSVSEERGANAGRYRVEIRWSRKTGSKYRDPDSGELYDNRKEGLPPRYHKESELTAEVSEAQTTFDFALKSR